MTAIKPCKIGWSPKEITWLKAALTLPAYECLCALDDIASMSGRTISAIRSKAKEITKPEPKPAPVLVTAPAPLRQIMVPHWGGHPPIKQPTKQQLMGAR